MAPPKEPVLNRAPDRAEWTIKFQYNKAKAKEQFTRKPKGDGAEELSDDSEFIRTLLPKEITVTKNGKVYREVTKWSNGRRTEKWIIDGLQLLETPQTGEFMRVGLAGIAPDFSDYRRSDFEDAEWIGLDNYTGLKQVANGVAYEFSIGSDKKRLTPREKTRTSNEESISGSGLTSAGTTIFVAYLDVKSQLPLYLENGHTVRIYSYSRGPIETLVPPPKFAKELEGWRKEITRRNRPAAAP